MNVEKLEAYLDGLTVFDLLNERSSELSDVDLSFIGGGVKKFRPKRILEIGVAGGGTTCFVLQCLEKMNIDAKMYSVDLAYTFHKDKNKKCFFSVDMMPLFFLNFI